MIPIRFCLWLHLDNTEGQTSELFLKAPEAIWCRVKVEKCCGRASSLFSGFTSVDTSIRIVLRCSCKCQFLVPPQVYRVERSGGEPQGAHMDKLSIDKFPE